MSDTPTIPPPDDPLLPAKFPCDFRDGLDFIKGESVSEKLGKVRRFIEWGLTRRRVATPANIKAVFLARQRKLFTDETDWRDYAAKWLHWWNAIEIPRIRRLNARNLKKPIDPEDEGHG